MFREFLGTAVSKKNFLMFFTTLVYMLGLVAFFTEKVVLVSSIITILALVAIIKNFVSYKLVLFWYIVFFLAFFNASLRIQKYDNLYKIAPQDAQIYGQIVTIPDKGLENRTRFFMDVDKITYQGKTENIEAKTFVTVSFYKKPQMNFKLGDYYMLDGKLRAPFEVSNPSQFDYGKYLRNFNAFSVFYAKEDACKKLTLPQGLKWRLLQKLNSIRTDIMAVHANYLKSPNLEILGGIVFGDDAVSPPDNVKQSFQYSGLLHILAASGMNVALIYGIWLFIMTKFCFPYKFSVVTGIGVVLLYTLMTGLGPSVIRAAIMLIFILIGKLIDRDTNSVSLLCFVGLLMLIYNPCYINDVSFQLSFIVTFGLLVMSPYIFEKFSMPNWLSGAIFVPMIAQIWVAPIQMYYFNSFSLYSILANILILPFLTVISFGGFVSAVLSVFKPVAIFVCRCFDFVLNPCLTILVSISDFFAELPHSLIQMPQPNGIQIFLYYSIVLLITLAIKSGLSKKLFVGFLTLLVLLGFSFINFDKDKFEVIVFDVQNADCFLIKNKTEYFIIDSGKMGYNGGKSQAKFIILEYLKDKGIKSIEGLILSHFDSDHAGGAVDLIENLNIKKIYVNSKTNNSNIAKKIYSKTNRKIIEPKNGEMLYSNGDFRIKNFVSKSNNVNESSLITLVSKGDFDLLFMGDGGVEAYSKIGKNLPENIEVLKVGHHGAKNVVNKHMLERLNPKFAIISTGFNTYGHPNGVTLNILDSYNIKTYRTDRHNAIKITQNQLFSYENKGWVLLK